MGPVARRRPQRTSPTATTSPCGRRCEQGTGASRRVGSGAATRERIIDAALETVRRDGFTDATARAIAATGGFNQALIFYHFGSVEALLDEAFRQASEHQVARYREAVGQLDGLSDLVAIARRLHEEDLQSGSITLITQMMAAATTPSAVACCSTASTCDRARAGSARARSGPDAHRERGAPAGSRLRDLRDVPGYRDHVAPGPGTVGSRPALRDVEGMAAVIEQLAPMLGPLLKPPG